MAYAFTAGITSTNKEEPMKSPALLIVLTLLLMSPAHAGWQDWLKNSIPKSESGLSDSSTTVASLSEGDITEGLRQALDKGVVYAVNQLGREGGFLNDPQVRIPLPERLQWAEKALRTLHQDALADRFVASMNQAAEQAVPEALDIFRDSLSKMSVTDAQSILQGEDDAATRYFREHGETELRSRLRPLVSEATAAVGVTDNYKKMTSKADFLGQFASKETLDLDGYVTDRALDGLFLKIAEEERKIRENPLERSTDLLKRVFGQ